MPKKLTEAQIAGYRRDGYVYPLPGVGAERAAQYRRDFEAYEEWAGGRIGTLGRTPRYKTHVLLPWCWEIARDPAILDAVEDLIGPDILIWTSSFFVKEAHTESVALWHQDSTYFGLRPHEHVTAWVAITNASAEAGCMQFIPEQGAARQYKHKANADPRSINGGGQAVSEPFDEHSAVTAQLRPGDFSMHHTLCIHSSPANRSNDRRIGIGISYIPTRVRHTGTVRVSATLARGTDRYGHFDLETPATGNRDEDKARHTKACDAYMAAYAEQIAWHDEGRTAA
ncbi:MAG: phytanoyl-CoA dioxygenase family protein [Bdellovibrionales bacterium]